MEDVKLLDKINRFLSKDNGSGYGTSEGSGDGHGNGDSYGYGDIWGNGNGSGYGSGEGSGHCSAHGYLKDEGFGYGKGYSQGSGDGGGNGYGAGYGNGYCYGGLTEINGHKVFLLDHIATIFTSVKENVAKGFILQADMTMAPCYVVKENGLFAHGYNLHEAMESLADKLFDDMSEAERIAEFIEAHPDPNTAYPNQDLFDWHHRLTGSCMAGRIAFMKNRGLTLEGETTVAEFIQLTKNAYNGYIIALLEEAYK